jgi:hypothetical protein
MNATEGMLIEEAKRLFDGALASAHGLNEAQRTPTNPNPQHKDKDDG